MLNTPSSNGVTRTILVVEDEPDLATAIAQRIASQGWQAHVASDGVSAVRLAEQLCPDLIIMDLMLPGMDGIEATRRIINQRPVPILMLTARDAEADKIIGLSAGADDYMTKPFSPRELIARCVALLRRVERATQIARVQENERTITFGSLIIKPRERLVLINNKEIHFTPTEFNLLLTLAQRPHTVFKRETLLEKVWDWPDASSTRTVDSHIKSLRRKLGSVWIRTIHGIGYAFEPPSSQPSSLR